MSDVTLNDKALKRLVKAFKDIPSIKIGVLGGASVRGLEDGAPTNAEVLAAAEYGTEHSPVRSVLRKPLSDHLGRYLERAGAFNADLMRETIKNGTIRPYCQKIAGTAEAVVHDAFQTQGFSEWPQDAPETMARKKVKQVLVETQQMRNAISTEVS